MGYGYALQFSGRVLPERKGFAMGFITAAYALGAVIYPFPLRLVVEMGGWTTGLLFLAICLLGISALSVLVLSQSRMVYAPNTETPDHDTGGSGRQVVWLWISYCGAVTAGLMVIAHATGLAEARGSDTFWIVVAPIVIASANMAGSLLWGVLIDKTGGQSVLVFLTTLSGITLLIMAIATSLTTTLIGLTIVGFAYGGTIAAYPAYISNRFGATAGVVIYARVFTAWAAAGLLGPYVAGRCLTATRIISWPCYLAAFATAISLVSLLTTQRGSKNLIET